MGVAWLSAMLASHVPAHLSQGLGISLNKIAAIGGRRLSSSSFLSLRQQSQLDVHLPHMYTNLEISDLHVEMSPTRDPDSQNVGRTDAAGGARGL